MQKQVIVLMFLFGSAGVAFAHGSAHDKHGVSGHPGDAKKASRTVKLELKEYSFSAADLSVKAGETVKFVVTNTGRLKHELTIGTAAEQEAHRKEMEAMSDMKHDEGTHAMPANSIHVGPGQTRELVWTFTTAGKLEFACNYPGHADLGMEGKISVQ